MSGLYPDFTNKLRGLGAVRLRMGKDAATVFPNGKTYSFAGAVREPRDLGIDLYCQSRGLLEHCVRQCTLASTNVKYRTGCAVE
jgi:hypothetical protein